MAVYMQLPRKNINVEDIRDTLNAYGGNVNNNVETFFSEGAKINMWSKRKPVKGVPAGMNVVEPNRDGNWYIGVDLNCGIIPSQIPTPKQAITQGSEYDWTYELPTGGKDSPLRIGDFGGYNTQATPPFNTGNASDVTLFSNTGSKIVYIYPNLTGSELQFSDFKDNSASIGSCYMYAIMYNSSGVGVDIQRSTTKVSQWLPDGTAGVTIDMTGKPTGTYTVYTFFCDEEELSASFTDSDWADFVLYSMPYTAAYKNPFTVTYKYDSGGSTVSLSSSWNGCTNGGYFNQDVDWWETIDSAGNESNPYQCPDGKFSVFLDVYNGSDTSKELSGSAAQIRYNDGTRTQRILNFSALSGLMLDKDGNPTGESWSGIVIIPPKSHAYFSVNMILEIDGDYEDPYATQFSLYYNNVFCGSNIDDVWVYPYWT